MRQYILMIVLTVALLGLGRPAHADCFVVDQLDKLYSLQTRLANNPDTALFKDDIRQLRIISRDLSNSDALEAVDGGAMMGRGADFARLLQNTRSLLRNVTLDDPYSVRRHSTRAARQNLQDIGAHLIDLRCTETQISIARAGTAANPIRTTSDAEDLQKVAEVLKKLARQVFQLRTLAIVIVTAVVVSITIPLVQRRNVRGRMRARRHTTAYATRYRWAGRTVNGMLLDINCHGTKLRHEASDPLPPGTPVEISIEDEWTGGTVMWSNVHYSGVQFSRLIDLSQVDAICLAGKTRPKTQNGAPKDAVS